MHDFLFSEFLNSFNNLSEDEKNAILLYQSRLFYFINEISSIDSYSVLQSKEIYACLKDKELFEKQFNEYKEIINNPHNLFFKMGIFQHISFDNLIEFIDSICNVIDTLVNIKNKIILDKEITLYRGVNIDNLDSLSLGKGKFISTSLDPDVALEFTSGGGIQFYLN